MKIPFRPLATTWVIVVSGIVGAHAQTVSAGGSSPAVSAENPGQGQLVVGTASTATGYQASAFGINSAATGAQSVALGTGSNATNQGSTATGFGSAADGAFTTAIGTGSGAHGDFGTATGAGAIASGNSSAAYGFQSAAAAANSTAVGANSIAGGNNSTAVGVNSTASTNAIAIGYGATAGFLNSTAIGNGATTTANNQVALGTTSNTYKLAGLTSAASLAAQSGPISVVTTDAAGHLAATSLTLPDISGLQSTVSGLQSSVGVLQQQMKQSFEGSAIAISMGGTALPADKRFAISTNWGNFRGQNAASVVAQMRLTDYAVVNVGVGAGFQQGGIGSRAGVTFAW